MILNDKADVARFSAEQLYGLSTSDSPGYQNIAPLAVGATGKTNYGTIIKTVGNFYVICIV